MPFIPAVETWRVAITYDSLGGNAAANVIYVIDDTTVLSSARAQTLADLIRAWLVSDWADIANTNWIARRVDVASAESQTGASASELTPTVGAVAQPPMPSQDTIAIRLETGMMGRSNRGRLYHVGLSEADISDGLVNSTFTTAATNAYEALRSALLVDDYSWCVASFFNNGAPRAAAQTRVITQVGFADNKVDRQLRRKK